MSQVSEQKGWGLGVKQVAMHSFNHRLKKTQLFQTLPIFLTHYAWVEHGSVVAFETVMNATNISDCVGSVARQKRSSKLLLSEASAVA